MVPWLWRGITAHGSVTFAVWLTCSSVTECLDQARSAAV
jgi:hypothetical protein